MKENAYYSCIVHEVVTILHAMRYGCANRRAFCMRMRESAERQ